MRLLHFWIFIFQLGTICATGQTIFTIAGSDNTNLGDNGPASEATLNNPYGIVFDKDGNLYVADRNNHRIRKITKEGIITTIAGNGVSGYSGDGKSALKARINYPIGLVVDKSGDLLFSDRYNNCIRKIELSGKRNIYTIAGTGVAGYSGEGGPAKEAQLNGPAGLMAGKEGSIYVCDAYNNCLKKIDQSGIITTIAGNGIKGYQGDGGKARNAEMNEPYFIVADADGNMYVSEFGNEIIRMIGANGIITTYAGTGKMGFNGENVQATIAMFKRPTGLLLDKTGNLIVADGENNRIRKITRSGVISTIAGNGVKGFAGDGGVAESAKIDGPAALAIDTVGTIYFSDLSNNRIRAFTYLPDPERLLDSTELFRITPDPTRQTLTFDFVATGDALIKLIDLDGKLLDTQVLRNKSTAVFNVKGYKPGLYLYEAYVNGQKHTGKFRID